MSFTNISAQQFSFGPLLGVHAYEVRFADKDARKFFNAPTKVGYRAGLFITFPVKDNFQWTAELFYSKKGRNIKYEEFSNIATYHFIEANALLKRKFDVALPNVKGNVFFTIGPNINYWLSGKGVFAGNVGLDYDVHFQEEAGNELTENYIVDGNRWLFGLDIGIGTETTIFKRQRTSLTEKENIQLELRFTLGQTHLGAENGSVMPNNIFFIDNLEASYRSIALVVKYDFDLNLKNTKKGKSTIKNK